MKLSIVTCLWGRREVSKLVLDYYKSLDIDGVDLSFIAVATQDEDMTLARKCGWHARWHINIPLSDKFNEGFRAAENFDPDAVMVIGSDNLITPNYFEVIRWLLTEKKNPFNIFYAAPGGTYFYSPELDECRYVRSPSGCGAGRVLSKGMLNTVNWAPYDTGAEKYIESKMKSRLGEPDFLVDVSPGLDRYVVDIKTKRWEDSTEGTNIHSYEKMARSLVANPVDPELIHDAFPTLNTLLGVEP